MNRDKFPPRDNHELTAVGETLEFLESILATVPIESVGSYASTGGNQLCFYRSFNNRPCEQTFPVVMPPKDLSSMIMRWIEKAHFPPKPDIDGDLFRGWHLVSDHREIAISPEWMICHK